MNKAEFLQKLRAALSGLPQSDVEEKVEFYSEMIDDRMEDGLSEEEAVATVGSVEEIVREIVADIPLSKIAKEKIKPKRKMRAWEIILLILGSPIWLSLLIAVFAVILSAYACIWSAIAAFWSGFAALVGVCLGGFVMGIWVMISGSFPVGLLLFGGGLLSGGLAVFAFFGCHAATKGVIFLTKRLVLWTKERLFRKESEA